MNNPECSAQVMVNGGISYASEMFDLDLPKNIRPTGKVLRQGR